MGLDSVEAIIEYTEQIADPLRRTFERQRLTRELYQQQAAKAKAKSDADEDADEAEAIVMMADCALELAPESKPVVEKVAAIADGVERLSSHYGRGKAARRLCERARSLRRHANLPIPASSCAPAHPIRPRARIPRPRGRRACHIARRTSSADSGDDPSGDDPSEELDLAVLAGQFVVPGGGCDSRRARTGGLSAVLR